LRRVWLLVARVEDFFGMAPRTAAPPAEFPGWKKHQQFHKLMPMRRHRNEGIPQGRVRTSWCR
jgi:hypothetical protein